MKLTKPEDSAAKAITFGVELETQIPDASGVNVGHYHGGVSVSSGHSLTGHTLRAPSYSGLQWKAERDGSIQCEANFKACEFISPILSGDDGISNVCHMVDFIRAVGGRVNNSCGCHITIGIESVIGTLDRSAVGEFCQRVAHVAQSHAWAIYAQTGSGRHVNRYSHQFGLEVETIMSQLVSATDEIRRHTLVNQCGRGMVNFNKVFSHGVIEFRAFAGTLNENKLMHHLATVFGIVRRAATVKTFGKFNRKATKKHSGIANATEAVRRMWRLLGWVDSVPNRDCALGLFGRLHSNFSDYRNVAVEMAEKFEQRFPAANL